MLREERARVAVLSLAGLDGAIRHALHFDGRDVPDTGERPLQVETDAGTHTLVAEREGMERFVWEGSLTDGQHLGVEVLFQPIPTGRSDDTAVHWVIAIATTAAVIAGGVVLGYFLWEGAQVQPGYALRVNL
jgi:hypothetical protein